MLNNLIDLLLPMIFGISMIIVGCLYKTHLYSLIGENAGHVSNGRVDYFKWLCAKALGPQILIRIGSADIMITFLIGVLALIFGYDTGKISMVSSLIGAGFLLFAVAFIEEKVRCFSPDWLIEDDNEKKEIWIKTYTDYAKNKEYYRLISFVEADMIQPE